MILSYKTTPKLDKFNDECLFINALNVIREQNKLLDNSMKEVHKKVILSEIKDETFLLEVNIKDIITSIIDFFIEGVTKLFNRFKNLFLKYNMSDKTIEKYADQLKYFDGTFQINFKRYNFTCFGHDIPHINLKSEFIDQFDQLEGKFKELANSTSDNELLNRLITLEGQIKEDINETYYDMARARSINSSKPFITQNDYASELFKVYRDGGDEASYKINFIDTTKALDQYRNYKNTLKEVEKFKNETINAAKDIENKIKAMRLGDFNKSYIFNDKCEVMLNRILSAKSGQVNKVCNIYTLAFSAKLDAIKESYIQNRRILYDAILYINSKK